jgi:hypothetical protein
LNLSHLDFDIPNMEFTLDVSSRAFLSGELRISSLCYINSTNSYVRIYKQIMQNKPKVKYAKINVSSFVTSNYAHVGHLVIQTNKAKTNPIKAKTNPIQSQLLQRAKLMQSVYIQSITSFCDA